MSWIVNVSGALAAPWMVKRSETMSTKRRTGAGCRGNATPLLRHHRDLLRSDAPPWARRSSIIALLPDADLTWAA